MAFADEAPPVATGTVTAARKPVAGVLVTNGREIVVTGADGTFSVPVSPGQSVGVITPSGLRCRAPSIPYLPAGSPKGFRFDGLPKSPLLPSYDFALIPIDAADDFDAVLLTDPQPETIAELGYVRDDIVAQVAETDAAFAIVHGDLMFDDLSLYPRFLAMMEQTGLPWRAVAGNHDINVEAPDDSHSRDTFKRVFGARTGAFRHGRAMFVLLDNVEYLGPDPAKPGGLGKYQGRFGPDQLAFVRNLLGHVDPDSLVVFSFHIPLRTLVGTEPGVATVDARDFLDAISTHRNTVSFCGHTHTNEHHYFNAADGYAAGGLQHHHHVLAAASGSWWSGPFDVRGIPVALQTDGTPNGFHVLSVRGDRYSTRLIPAHDPARGAMRIMLDSQVHANGPEVLGEGPVGALLTGPLLRDQVRSTRVVVNLFDGGERSACTLQIGSRAIEMRRLTRNDPHVEEVFSRNAATKKPWVQAGKSSHIWQVPLFPELDVGTHRFVVRAVGESGVESEASMIVEIV